MQKKGININEELRVFIASRKQEIEEEKEEIAAATKLTKSKYVNVRIKNLKKKEAGTKCEMYTCNKPAEELHHTIPFAMSKTHNPKFLAQLCKEHHLIAQSVNLKFVEKRKEKIGSG